MWHKLISSFEEAKRKKVIIKKSYLALSFAYEEWKVDAGRVRLVWTWHGVRTCVLALWSCIDLAFGIIILLHHHRVKL